MTDDTRDFEAISEQRLRLQKEHSHLFEMVAAILFELDPMGIAFVDNSDEYDPEVGTILPRLSTCQSADDVRRVVFEEFGAWFSTPGVESDYDLAGQRIWEAWLQVRRSKIESL